jgi:tetratricopeptide (TPR) repeat protein
MNNRVDTSRDLLTPEEEDAGKHIKAMLQNGEELQALQCLAKLSGSNSFKIGDSYFLLGTIYFSAGRTDDAKRVLWTARTLSPDDSRIAAFLGITQLATGETEAAEKSFHSALALDADNPLALIGMGALRYQQQRWADTIEYLEKSRTADPDTLFLLCDAYYRVGKLDEAQLTAEVIRAFGANRKPLLDRLESLPHVPSN